MFELFRAEITYYWKYIWFIFAMLFAGMGFLAGQGDLFVPVYGLEIFSAWVVAPPPGKLLLPVAGLLVGLVHGFRYSRPAARASILSMPLSRTRVFLSSISGLFVSAWVAAILPLLLALMFSDLVIANMVDTRVYLFLLHMGLLASACGLIGIYIMHSASYLNFLVLIAIMPLSNLHATAATSLVLDLAIVTVSGILAWLSFVTPLKKQMTSTWRTIAMATPLVAGVYLVGVGMQPFVHISADLSDSGAETANKIVRSQNPAFAMLQASGHSLAATITQNDIEGSGTHSPTFRQRDTPGQLLMHDHRHPTFYFDLEAMDIGQGNHLAWVFSHDEMVYLGSSWQYGDQSAVLKGKALGVNGVVDYDELTDSDRFTTIPQSWFDRHLIYNGDLLSYPINGSAPKLLTSFGDGELLLMSHYSTGSTDDAMMLNYTSSAIRIYLGPKLDIDTEYPEFNHTFPARTEHTRVSRVWTLRLKNGNALAGRSIVPLNNLGEGALALDYLKTDGTSESIYRIDGYYNMRDETSFWWSVSPLGHFLQRLTIHAFADEPGYAPWSEEKRPVQGHLWILLLMVLSAAATWRLLKYMPVDAGVKRTWLGLAFIGGPAGFVAFLVLAEWRSYLRGKPVPAPKPARSGQFATS